MPTSACAGRPRGREAARGRRGRGGAAWDDVVEAYRSITQNADENVLLANTDREAIRIVNSDASARTREAGRFAGARAASIGMRACAGARG